MRGNWLPEIVKRSETGPYMKEPGFEMALAMRVPELVREFGIQFDREVLLPADDDMADRLYQAGRHRQPGPFPSTAVPGRPLRAEVSSRCRRGMRVPLSLLDRRTEE